MNWDADHADGKELAVAEFYSAGHVAADGADVRVTREDGRVLPSHVLGVGPGDLVRVVFALSPGQTRYEVYFGNPHPPPPPAGTGDVRYRGGLLLELRQWTGSPPQTPEEIVHDWDQAAPLIGQTMIDRPFYGLNPFGPQPPCLAKLTGSLVLPVDADYFFAGSVRGSGVALIDNNVAWFIGDRVPDARYHITVFLTHGRHDFTVYCGLTTDPDISIAWRRPDMDRMETIPRTAFGFLSHAREGALEEWGKPLVADFDVQYMGEAFVADHYSHRYVLTARHQPNQSVEFHWNLGDGQSADGAEVEHVYVTPGVYPIRLTALAGGESDTRTTQLAVDRQWETLDHPMEDPPFLHARIVGRYDVSRVPEAWLPWIASIEDAAGMADAEAAALRRLATEPRHGDPDDCLAAMTRLSLDLEADHQTPRAVDFWDRVPPDSDLQPAAAAYEADLLTWQLADFRGALRVTQRVANSSDPAARRAYAMALVLNGRADEGARILDDLQQRQERAGVHLAAMSGAMARTVEYRIEQEDAPTGEQDWRAWEQRCPADFMQGYSVLLRIELMEQRHDAAQAAAVAEAFALAVPDSPYAPQLLYRAGRLLAATDPARSAQLRDTLRQRYPEDPLSQ